MSKPDQFADLLSGLTTAKKNPNNLSLAEKQKLSSTNIPTQNNQWANFDILSQSGSRNSTPASTSNSTPLQSSSASLFEGFAALNNNAAPAQRQQTPQSQKYHNDHLFEGFGNSSSVGQVNTNNADMLDSFGLGSSSASSVSPTPPPAQTNASQSNGQDMDDIFAVFDKPVQPQAPVRSGPPSRNRATEESPRPPAAGPDSGSFRDDSLPQRPRRNGDQRSQSRAQPNNDAYDQSIANLVDMGFSIEQATEALKHTHDGLDVQEAISYIMTKAHNQARANQGLPPDRAAYRASTHQKSPEQYLQTFSSLVSKATNDLTNRLFSPPPATDGRPAWMRDQEKHKKRATQQYDEDPEELTTAELERLSLESQRKPAQKSRPQPPVTRNHPRSNSSLREEQHDERASARSSAPQRQNVQPTPEPEVDLFAPLPTKPQKPEPVDLFSSPIPSATPSRNGASSSNEMRTSSRRRTTPGISSPSVTPKVQRPAVSISQTQLEFFEDSRKQGGISFKNGDFTTALTHYTTALESLPPNHILRIIGFSNVIAAYYKVGEHKKVVEYADEALKLIGKDRGVGEEVEPSKPMKDFWVKILQKKAEALEHLEKFKDSLEAWTELIENGSANKISLEGKRRCQKELNPTRPPSKQAAPKPARTPQPSKPATPDNSEAVKKLKESNKESEKFENDKFLLKDQIDSSINRWKNGKEDNLRALLSSLQDILWESSNWKPVGMSELVMPKKVRIVYMKAVAKVHPDKIPKDASSEQKIIAESVFVVINQAWETFKNANGLQ